MDKEKAIALWTQIERMELHEDADDEEDPNHPGWDRPAFAVRLDAQITTDWDEPRDYRVRVTPNHQVGYPLGVEWYADVVAQASEAQVDVSIQNNGIELF